MDDLGINQWLKENYGTTGDLKPIFRVVWSTNLTEKRFGEFDEYSGHIFLRQVKGVKEVLKYPFDQNRWILEQFCEIDQRSQVAKELIENKYSYEPLWIFKDKKGKYLPLDKRMIEFILFFYLNRHKHKKTAAELTEEEYKKEEAETEKIRQLVGEKSPVWSQMDLVY